MNRFLRLTTEQFIIIILITGHFGVKPFKEFNSFANLSSFVMGS